MGVRDWLCRLPKRPESPFCLEVEAGGRLASGAADRAHLALPSPSRLPPGLLMHPGTCAHWHGDCAYVSHAPLYSPCLATRCCARDVCSRLNTCQKSLGSPRLPSLPQRSALTPRVLYSFFSDPILVFITSPALIFQLSRCFSLC